MEFFVELVAACGQESEVNEANKQDKSNEVQLRTSCTHSFMSDCWKALFLLESV